MAATLGRWNWAYVTFRVADGATSVLFPLAAILRYDLGVGQVAGVVALLNLGSVPATFTWCRIMERHPARRRFTILGMGVAALAFAALALPLPLWGYLTCAVTAVAFGVATAPSAGILVLEGRPRREWAAATGLLSRRTATAYMVGLGLVLVLGLLDALEPHAVFAGAAMVAGVAAVVAARTIVPRADLPDPGPHAPKPGEVPVEALRQARRMERVFFFPSRLRFRPRRLRLSGPGDLLLAGVVLMFMGTLTFFSGYQGVLVNVLGLSAGMVLLAETGSHLANTLAFAWAGGLGARRGEPAAIRLGLAVRVVALGVLVAGIVWGGEYAILILVCGGLLMGISFSLLHVNIPVLLAGLTPAAGAKAVGSYHTAVASGVLGGALAGFAANLLLAPRAVYVVALALLLSGVAVVLAALGRAGSGAGAGARGGAAAGGGEAVEGPA